MKIPSMSRLAINWRFSSSVYLLFAIFVSGVHCYVVMVSTKSSKVT